MAYKAIFLSGWDSAITFYEDSNIRYSIYG